MSPDIRKFALAAAVRLSKHVNRHKNSKFSRCHELILNGMKGYPKGTWLPSITVKQENARVLRENNGRSHFILISNDHAFQLLLQGEEAGGRWYNGVPMGANI